MTSLGSSITPVLSIVMSVYNGGDALPITLASVLSQEGIDLEFIVINDGSTDESTDILDEWAAVDVRLRVVHQRNSGLTRALIHGCAVARGEFIARQDCGDLSLPGRLAKQLALLRDDEKLDLVSCWTRYATIEAEPLYEVKGSGRALQPLDVIDMRQPYGVLDGPAHHGSVMFRRTAYQKVGGYRPDFYYGQDWDLWFRLAEHGQFQMLPELLYEARLAVSDISMNNKSRQEQIGRQSLRALRLRQAGLSEQAALDAASNIRPGGKRQSRGTWRGCYFIGESLRRNGNRASALRYLARALKENPLHVKSWMRYCQARFG